MKFFIFINENSSHQKNYTNLLKKSLLNNDLQEGNLDNCDFLCTWAFKPKVTGSRWDIMKRTGKPVLVLERGYIGDRLGEWTSLGWDGLNGRADFCNASITDLNRFNKYFKNELKPWRKVTEDMPVLVIGQCFHDASVAHMNIHDFYDNTISKLRAMGHKVIFRPHPLNREPYNCPVPQDKNSDIYKTFNQVKAVVTVNSNVGVLSTLYGLPTYTHDIGAMAYEVTSHDLENLSYMPDRTNWAAKMAYTQWNKQELENGTAWEHIKQKIIKPTN